MTDEQQKRQVFQVLRDAELYGSKFLLNGEPKSVMVTEPLMMFIAYCNGLDGGVPSDETVTMNSEKNDIKPLLFPVECVLRDMTIGKQKVFPMHELLPILNLDGERGQYSHVSPDEPEENANGVDRLHIDVEVHLPGQPMKHFRVFIPEFQVQDLSDGHFLSTNLHTMLAVKEHLDMWHIDYMMLIPKGLAVDARTLEQEVY